jgi:hypothetical protein
MVPEEETTAVEVTRRSVEKAFAWSKLRSLLVCKPLLSAFLEDTATVFVTIAIENQSEILLSFPIRQSRSFDEAADEAAQTTDGACAGFRRVPRAIL